MLGSLLLEPVRLAGEIFAAVRPEDFTDASLRNLFTAARALWMDQTPLDPVTLLDRAGREYEQLIRDVLAATPTAANWRSYCKIVKNNAQLRDLHGLAYQVLECEKAEEALGLLLQAQALLAQRQDIRVTPFRDMAADFLDRMTDRKPPTFLDWGFPALNEQVPITQGRFVVLAALSSVGKTALALQIAFGLARGGKKVGFFSLETSAPDAADRIFSNVGNVRLPDVKRRRLAPEDIRRCTTAALGMNKATFDIIEAPGCTVDEVRALTLAGRYDVIFVDYVQMLTSKGPTASEQVRSVSIGLHTLALSLGVTVIGLSQVSLPDKNNAGKRGALTKENVRDSAQLAQDAEALLILDLVDPTDYRSNRTLLVDKNKDGVPCKMILEFDGVHMRFTYVPPYEDDEAKAARERCEKMDANRAERQAKEWRKNHPEIEGQESFRESEEAVPFEK